MDATPPHVVVPAALAAQGRADRRARRRSRLFATVVLVLVVVPPVAWLVLARGTSPADGTMTYPSDWSSSGVQVLETTGVPTLGPSTCDAPLRKDDVVTHIDGRSIQAWVENQVDRPAPDGQVTYTVAQDGETCRVDISLGPFPWSERVSAHALVLPLVLVLWAVGTFVFLKRPRDWAAQALFAMAVLLPWGATSWPFGIQVIDLAEGPRLWHFVVGDIANALLWGAILQFALSFPRPVPPLRARPARLTTVYAVPFVLYFGHVAFGPLLGTSAASGSLGRLGDWLTISAPSARIVPVLVTGIVWWQYRHAADDAERRRFRLIVYTLLLCAGLYLGLGQIPDFFGDTIVPYDWLVVVFVTLPVALGVAVLQYGIFDLQILVKRSLVYGTLTTVLVVLPAAVGAALLTTLSDHPARLTDAATLNVILGTALVAALFFQTLRVRLKRRISRLVFGARDDPYEVIGQLGDQLQSKVPADAVLAGIAETVANALRLPYVAIEVLGPDGVDDRATHGEAPAAVQAVALTVHGEEVGRLYLGSGTRSEPFGPADQKLLELLGQQVGITAENVLLASRLQRSLERAISTREEERRRLRRDIHDGLGPMLAAGRMRLEVARQLMATDPNAAADLLSDLVHSQQMVIDDVRRLVDDLRPPVLDQIGLVSAIQERAEAFSGLGEDGSRLEVTLEASPNLEPLPAAVEVATYRIVLEALTNVARHAHAHRCRIRITRGEALQIEVTDDGIGLPGAYRAGVGLNSMRERASEMGGICTIYPGPGTGTIVEARLPVHSP